MPQVMEANVPVASRSLNAGGFQLLSAKTRCGVSRGVCPSILMMQTAENQFGNDA